MLTLPSKYGRFVVYSDVSHQVLGCILMQHGKVISYISRQLKMHEMNYPTYDLELTEVIYALKYRGIIYMVRNVKFLLTI